MTLNEIFDIYGNKLPTKSYRVFDGDILEWDFAIDPKKDDFDLIAKGIACDWSIILENGSWTEAIVSRDRIKRELEKEADAIYSRNRATGREAKDWLTLTPEPVNPIQDTYKETYFIKVNHHGQITERQSAWYWSENKYYENEGASYIYEHSDSFGIRTKYNYHTGRLEWLQGKPKLPNYAKRST
jgi:hypothetical protein